MFFQVLYVLCFTRPRYQVSVYRTIGPLVDFIILIFEGNEDMHKILNEFKFRPYTTTNSRVICPCASKKLMYNAVKITSRTSLKLGQIRPRTSELAALERLEKSP